MPEELTDELAAARFREVCRLHAIGKRNIRNAIMEEFPGIDLAWRCHFVRLWMRHYENKFEGSRAFRAVYRRPESMDRPTTPYPLRRGDAEPDIERYVLDLRARSKQPPPGFGPDLRLLKPSQSERA